MIVTTPAIVLHSRPYGESSRIVTLYTRDYGRMGVVARGVSRPRSRLAALLQPMSHISVVVYTKEGRDLQNLSAAETLSRSASQSISLEALTAGLSVVELVNAVTLDHDPNYHLFDELVLTLRYIGSDDAPERRIQLGFMVRTAEILGYALRTDVCGVCEEALQGCADTVRFNVEVGAPLCLEHRDSSSWRLLSRIAFEWLHTLVQGQVVEVDEEVPGPVFAELHDLLGTFLKHHVEGMRRLRVGGVAVQLLGDAAEPTAGAPLGGETDVRRIP